LQFAVDVLKVRHVNRLRPLRMRRRQAAIDRDVHGLADNWLRHVQDVERDYQHELDGIADAQKRVDRLCELGTSAEQVR
jgi:carbonic anhydrase